MDRLKLAKKIITLLGIEDNFIQSVNSYPVSGIEINIKLGESSKNIEIYERFAKNGFKFFFFTSSGTVVFNRKLKGRMTPVTLFIRTD